MSDKTKKFNPPMGWIVSVNHQEVSIRRLADALKIAPYVVGKALEDSGYVLEPDQMDLAADTAKVILQQEKMTTPLRVVPEPTMADIAESVTELDEEDEEAVAAAIDAEMDKDREERESNE
jgi:acyl-homoserine lactone acylase PvdQ